MNKILEFFNVGNIKFCNIYTTVITQLFLESQPLNMTITLQNLFIQCSTLLFLKKLYFSFISSSLNIM